MYTLYMYVTVGHYLTLIKMDGKCFYACSADEISQLTVHL